MQRISIRLRLVALAVLLALGAQTLAHAVPAARQYTVKPGDTLGAISVRHGVLLDELVALNNLGDADHILAGQTLLLPDAAAPAPAVTAAPPAAPREYIVKAGDSLSLIAAGLGVPMSALLEANALANPDRLAVGQKLVVPGGQPTGATATQQPATGGGAGADSSVGELLEEAAARHGVDSTLVKSVAWYLSSWRPDALSPGGAVGVMQITGAAQEWVGKSLLKRSADRADLRDNIDLGVAYLAYLTAKFGDEKQAVAAYLQGPASLARGGISPGAQRALDAIYGSLGRFEGSAGGPPAAQRRAAPGRDLNAAILAAARSVSPTARVGIAGRKLATGERIDVQAGDVFPSASVNKIPIMAEVFRQLAAGKLKRTPAVETDLDRMITLSDNDAANRLLDAVGEGSVNATMANLGLGSIALHNYFSYLRGPTDPGFNQTSPADMAALLAMLARDELVGPVSSRQMRDLLLRAQDVSKLVRGVPGGTRVAHKSGWYDGVANDAGIVYAPGGTYVLAVFSQGVGTHESGNELIGAVSRAVYEAWGR